MFLSRGCEYAIQTMLYLAKRNNNSYVSIKEIAKDSNLSFYYLGKVIQNLTNTSLLDSYKGPNGGIKLGKKPEEITVIEIVEAIDGLKAFEKCFIGLSTCNTQSHCALHNDWKGIRNKIYEMLQNKNLAQLINS